MPHVTCAHCQAALVVPELLLKRGKCPKCGKPLSGLPELKGDDARPAAVAPSDDDPLMLADEPVAKAPAKPARPAATTASQRIAEAPDDDEEQRGTPEEIPVSADPVSPAHRAPAVAVAVEKAPETPPTPGGLIVTRSGQAIVVAFHSDRLLDATIIEAINQELISLLQEKAFQKLVLDFTNVLFLSSQMIGTLLTADKHARAGGKRLILCGTGASLTKLLKIVHLDKTLASAPDRASALRA